MRVDIPDLYLLGCEHYDAYSRRTRVRDERFAAAVCPHVAPHRCRLQPARRRALLSASIIDE